MTVRAGRGEVRGLLEEVVERSPDHSMARCALAALDWKLP